MNKTELLYYNDPYQFDFSARVLSCERNEGAYDIILDRTCFYPEGGGQPADTGTIDGKAVTHVRKNDGVVYHRMASEPEATAVHCVVDRSHRTDYMQQHTGQHILSAVLYRSMGYNTVSVHFGDEYASIEIDTDTLGPEGIERLEDETNALICRNMPIHETWTTSDRLNDFSLRRPSSVEGDVRVISIGDYDTVACGGVHCSSTGEIGLVKVLGTEKIRGRTRLLFKIGRRAYEDYRLKHAVAAELGVLFSSQPAELVARAGAALDEITTLKQELATLKREKIIAEADRLLANTDPDENGLRRIACMYPDYENRDIIDLVKHLIRAEGVHACCISPREDDLFWCFGCSEELDVPFPTWRNEILAPIEGKGGGRHPLWQGMGRNTAGTEEFTRLWRRMTSNET